MSVPQIVSRVLAEHGIRDDSLHFDLKNDYPKRDFCAQYRETDLQLVQRLCADEGIHYHFQHSRKNHVLVFGDSLRVFRRTSVANLQHSPVQAGVSRFSLTEDDGLQAESIRRRGQGESTLPFVSSGSLLPLRGHPDDSLNHLWLVTEVIHRGLDPRQLRRVTTHDASLYINHFQVAPWESGFKPQSRPRAFSATIQCAHVVGAADEPASRDAHGRVRVQLDWGYQGEGAAYADCWLPVAPEMNTDLFGGMQVVVSFSENDMDQPIISACMWQPTDAALEQPQLPRAVEKVSMHLGRMTADDNELCIQIEGGPRISYEEGSELSLTVGDSTLSIDASGVKLSSPHIVLAAAEIKTDAGPGH